MNRNFPNAGKIYSMHVAPVLQSCNISIGASGAVTAFTQSTMISSVSHDSTGLYTIHFRPGMTVNAVINVSASMQSPVSGLSGVLAIECQNAPSTSMQIIAAPVIQIKALDPAGALVNPASGSTIQALMIFNNSSVKS